MSSVLLSRYMDYMLNRQKKPPVSRKDYFTLDANVVTRSEVKYPSETNPNLIFSAADFAKINDKKASYQATWDEIIAFSTGGNSPVAMAIEGWVLNDPLKKIAAFDQMSSGMQLEIDKQRKYQEFTKNAFNMGWAAYLIYDWCKATVSADARSNFRSQAHTLFSKGTNVDIDPLLHPVRVSGHDTTFYQHHDWKSIAFYDDQPIYFNHLLEDKFTGDGRREVSDFVQSGMSIHGTYSAPKVSGIIGQEMAWNYLIPKGKTFYHPHAKWVAYDFLYRTRINRAPIEDGEYNDNYYGGTSTGDFRMFLYWQETALKAHAIQYQDPVMVQAIDDLQNLDLYSFDQFVIRPLYLAAKILYDLSPSGGYGDLPKVKRTTTPVSKTIYVSKIDYTVPGATWEWGDRDTERYFAYELDMDESYVDAHDPLRMGNIQIAGKGGHKLTGSTGAWSGSHSSHAFNWNLGALGNNILRVTDLNDLGWDKASRWPGKIKNLGGIHFPFNNSFTPWTLTDYNNPARGTWAKKVSRSVNDEHNPTYIYDCIDLVNCYKGNGTADWHDRLNRYTRSAMAFPLNIGGALSAYDGIIFVLDRFDVVDPLNDYFLQWQLYQTPAVDLDNNKVSAGGANGTGKIHFLTMPTTDITIQAPTGWEGFDPTNIFDVPEKGKGDRVEVRPYGPGKVNVFLTAIVVGDDSNTGPVLADFSFLRNNSLIRVQFENKVWISRADDLILADPVTFEVVGTGTKHIVVTSLAAGDWSDGTNTYTSYTGENAVMLTAAPGIYTLTKI